MTDKQPINPFDPKEKIAERLRASRKTLEMTQTELAKQSGVGRSAIVHYENGKAVPGGMELIKLSKVLAITPNYILSGSERFRGSQVSESDLLTDDNFTMMSSAVLCLSCLSREVQDSVLGLMMNLVKQKLSKKEYKDFVTLTDNFAQNMRAVGFDPEKLMTQMDKDIDLDALNERLENQIKK